MTQRLNELRRSLLVSLWFMLLTFPIMVIRVNTITGTVRWRWTNLAVIGIGSFFISVVWRYAMQRKAGEAQAVGILSRVGERVGAGTKKIGAVLDIPKVRTRLVGGLLAAAVAYPFLNSMYHTNIMITALTYVVLGLGLNIIIGLGGMLHIGYAAFYAIGAYSYALLNMYFGINFWLALPIGAALAGLFSLLIGLPQLFGIDMRLQQTTVFVYFIMLAVVILTIFVVHRLENSRIGRQWVAMKEDYIACQAMGVSIAKAKLTALGIGAIWGGLVGVIFAARTTFINPASFTVWESVIILSTVVLGGMGSIPGVFVGALVLMLLPEYLRPFAQYRMLIFGALLVTMMVFRPSGFIKKRRKAYTITEAERQSVIKAELEDDGEVEE
ncbi:MAG: branched-chain amino acid ABC transporter permease [Spirochaeta sp.]|nr:branched-chain amino acid ABC transporter permease [Spirochaeta sp.]